MRRKSIVKIIYLFFLVVNLSLFPSIPNFPQSQVRAISYPAKNKDKEISVSVADYDKTHLAELKIELNQGKNIARLSTKPSFTLNFTQDSSPFGFLKKIVKKVFAGGNTLFYSGKKKEFLLENKKDKLTYTRTERGVKEEIILNSMPETNKFRFDLDLENLILKHSYDDLWYFYDQNDKEFKNPLFYIPKPFMMDNKGEKSEDVKIHYFSQDGQEYLEVEPDYTWLTDTARLYPVVIDPTIEVAPENNEIIELRTAHQKSFKTPEGTIKSRIYQDLLHYQDENGQWQEVDTTLKSSGDPNYAYQMENSMYKIKVKKYFNENNLLEITNNGLTYKITALPLYWENEKGYRELIAEPQKIEGYTEDSSVIFKNAYGSGLTFRVNLDNAKFDKWLVIEDLEALGDGPSKEFKKQGKVFLNTPLEISFSSKNIQLIQEKKNLLPLTGSIELLSNFPSSHSTDLIVKTNNSEARMKAPFYEETIDKIPHSIKWKISQRNTQTFKLDFLMHWDSLQKAQYPIKINADTTYYGETPDGYIKGYNRNYSTARSTSYSGATNGASEIVGQEGGGRNTYVWRLYFSFPTGSIPDNATIDSSQLFLNVDLDGSLYDFIVRVYRYDWIEPLASASNRETNYDGAYGASSTYEGNLLNTATGLTPGVYYSMSVGTSRINKTGDTKYSVVSDKDVLNSAPSGQEWIIFRMTEYSGTASDPYLEITYTLPPNTAPNTPSLSTPVDIPSPYNDFATYGRTLNVRPKLVWTIPTDTDNDNLHFKVYYDTSSGSTLVADSSSSQTGFEYFNGSSWTAFPAGGVTSTYYGNNARYKPQSNLTSGGATYYWKIIANDGTEDSTASSVRHFVVGGRTWTDSTITANTTLIRKVHIDELREEINYARNFRNMTDYSWTDATITANTTLIRKVHFDEARTAIEGVAPNSGESTPTWTDSTITANSTLIRKVHIDELRTALTNI